MSEEEKKKSGVSRREFLKDAGLVVGGATIGSMAFLSSCKTGTATTTSTVITTQTITPAPITITSTPAGVYTDPVDGQTFTSLDAMKAHFNAVHPNGDAAIVSFTVNQAVYAFQVKPYWSLARVLREGLGLFAVKEGCNYGECGSCTVMVNGVATFSCMVLACELEGATVLTVEGLSPSGTLNKVQQRFYDNEVFQCGICTPGFVMAAQALINANPTPTLAQVQQALSGHICMCGNLHRTVTALVGGV
jgi:aerobic-type carbon monoxide dehydrogenase small subunit (CoxS/CutS family)